MESTVSEKLDVLFKTRRKKDGKEFTYQEVAEGTGNVVSSVTVWKIRSGQIKNPSYRVLEAIANFFDVPIDYFSSTAPAAAEYAENLQLARQLCDEGVAKIALRVSDLDESARHDILAMIDYARRAQGLDTIEGEAKKDGETRQQEDQEAHEEGTGTG